jgi:F-type H+-transporting ATPase subunit b
MSLLIPDSGLLFWMIIAFGAVFIVLAKYGWPLITRMIDDRKRYIDESIASAREANERLASIREESAALLKQARDEQSRILAEAVESRNRIVEQAKVDAVAEGKKIVEEAKQRIEIEKEDALRDIRRQVALLSVQVSERVLRTTLSHDKEQMAMIDRMLDEVIESNK